MHTSSIPATLLALTAILIGNAAAEGPAKTAGGSDIRVVSSFVAPGEPVPGDCRGEAAILARSLARFPPPGSWHWVLVCDEAGWRRFLALSGRPGRDEIVASTDLAARTTYLRGARLTRPGSFQAQPDDVISHELAHIELDSPEEQETAALAGRWKRAAPA